MRRKGCLAGNGLLSMSSVVSKTDLSSCMQEQSKFFFFLGKFIWLTEYLIMNWVIDGHQKGTWRLYSGIAGFAWPLFFVAGNDTHFTSHCHFTEDGEPQ
jgi:hypothetical protein